MHHREAVAARQHDVEDDGVVAGLAAQQPLERLVAIALHIDGVAVGLEIESEPVGQVDFVFDNEDVGHRGAAVRSVPGAGCRARDAEGA